ncbi:MAG: SpaA isopeptide-forming pilin-related protein [Candidatus Dojkabacteria bacterium]|nr:SpaA isopeptide-forming pilin-related protein [Candidatus Dojkabacteria bacterium]MDQ7020797.1 SpaA isopeptide-forming pilin-related protein [Candidatus Dojkabacteria bacterium]
MFNNNVGISNISPDSTGTVNGIAFADSDDTSFNGCILNTDPYYFDIYTKYDDGALDGVVGNYSLHPSTDPDPIGVTGSYTFTDIPATARALVREMDGAASNTLIDDSEVLGFSCYSAPDPNGSLANSQANATMNGSAEAFCVSFNKVTGSIQGRKYIDYEGDGNQDDFYTNGWNIHLFDSSWNHLDSMTTGVENFGPFPSGPITGSASPASLSAIYRFTGLPVGTYYVCEESADFWNQISKGSNLVSVDTTAESNYNLSPLCREIDITISKLDKTSQMFLNQPIGVIRGQKYIDADGSGYLNSETNIEAWSIRLYDDSWNNIDSTATNISGGYIFRDLPFGTYYTCEVSQTGWRQSGPLVGNVAVNQNNVAIADVNLTAVDNLSGELDEEAACWMAVIDGTTNDNRGAHFGNLELATIQGRKFDDEDRSGDFDNSIDTRENGWDVYLYDSTWALQDQVLTGHTGNNGQFRFENLYAAAGGTTYFLCEENRASWIQSGFTFDGSNPGTTQTENTTDDVANTCLEITVYPGETNGSNRFLNFELPIIEGYKWDDTDGADGIYDSGTESRLENWTIFIDENGNEKLNGAEVSVTTDVNGYYSFTIDSGTYSICEVSQTGWAQSYPNYQLGYECHTVTTAGITSGEVITLNDDNELLDFGNYKTGILRGRKFEDQDFSGYLNNSEPELAGWTIRVYEDNAGSWDYVTETDTVVTTGSDGHYIFRDLAYGTYYVCEVSQDDWLQNSPLNIADVPLTMSGIARAGIDAAAVANSSGASDEESLCWMTEINDSYRDDYGLHFGNIQLGSIQGIKYEDVNLNGDFDGNSSSDNRLEDWKIYLYKDDSLGGYTLVKTTRTDINDGNSDGLAHGQYRFEDLPADTYYVCEKDKNIWTQTEPNSGILHPEVDQNTYCYTINLAAGEDKTGVQFGNYKSGFLQGRKYNDDNANGEHNTGELRIPGWEIVLYDDSWNEIDRMLTQVDGTPNSTVIHSNSTYADSRDLQEGQYRFSNLPTGTYYICEVQESYLAQTGPQLGSVPVDLDGNPVTTTNGTGVLNQSGDYTEGVYCLESAISDTDRTNAWLKFGNVELVEITVEKDVFTYSGTDINYSGIFEAKIQYSGNGICSSLSNYAYFDQSLSDGTIVYCDDTEQMSDDATTPLTGTFEVPNGIDYSIDEINVPSNFVSLGCSLNGDDSTYIINPTVKSSYNFICKNEIIKQSSGGGGGTTDPEPEVEVPEEETTLPSIIINDFSINEASLPTVSAICNENGLTGACSNLVWEVKQSNGNWQVIAVGVGSTINFNDYVSNAQNYSLAQGPDGDRSNNFFADYPINPEIRVSFVEYPEVLDMAKVTINNVMPFVTLNATSNGRTVSNTTGGSVPIITINAGDFVSFSGSFIDPAGNFDAGASWQARLNYGGTGFFDQSVSQTSNTGYNVGINGNTYAPGVYDVVLRVCEENNLYGFCSLAIVRLNVIGGTIPTNNLPEGTVGTETQPEGDLLGNQEEETNDGVELDDEGNVLGASTCETSSKIAGEVTDTDGNSIKDVQIDVYYFNTDNEREFYISVETDKNGKWKVDACPGKYEVVIKEGSFDEKFEISSNEIITRVLGENDEIDDIDFELEEKSEESKDEGSNNLMFILIPIGVGLLILFLVLASKKSSNNE